MRTLRERRRRDGLRLATAILALSLAGVASAGWLRPVEGAGNFYSTCDLVTLPNAGEGIDVVALVRVPHREVTFENEAGSYRARLRATATLVAPTGEEVTTQSTLRLTARSEAEAGSPTLSQVFTVVLAEVPFTSGRFSLQLEDLNRRRPGLVYLGTGERAFSLAAADWDAPPGRPSRGLSIGDAVYLAHAPIRAWSATGRPAVPGQGAGGPWDFINPARRYGLEAEALQVYFTVAPPELVEDRRRASARDLRLEIVSDHLDFGLVDTLSLTDPVRAALAAGNPAAVYWEMNAAGLPPGSFRLGIAPLDSVGRGLLTGFDVVWSLQQLARRTEDLLGEGRTVLSAEQLERFEAAPRVEQEAMLDEFWDALDPTPEDPYNEAYVEFRSRVAHVRAYYGGFDDQGAVDARGRIYLLLGAPDGIREEPVPMNEKDLEDARVLVYERYAPERLGSTVKSGDPHLHEGFSVMRGNYTVIGAIPMPYSYMADVDIRAHKTAADTRTFQLWQYDDAGRQLFPNQYSDHGGGLRFLFVDRTGQGEFVLESDNVRLMGD
ncbi:MAG TPA: GWxTD domain-containing protein [Candidatus Krumholzibacteria bacterium]|nr:GWxTD domain-containing protein [Candidatus Krumholzibacteria bacterium]HPD71346.1 GWxTD domain-containing protein [Candidatus Krumholzibacteria bacterium]HRY38954.1 GWxTD domain-containing protein [Candidatus Krumholzibacteria bacterium]